MKQKVFLFSALLTGAATLGAQQRSGASVPLSDLPLTGFLEFFAILAVIWLASVRAQRCRWSVRAATMLMLAFLAGALSLQLYRLLSPGRYYYAALLLQWLCIYYVALAFYHRRALSRRGERHGTLLPKKENGVAPRRRPAEAWQQLQESWRMRWRISRVRQCPACGGFQVRRSRPRGFAEAFMLPIFLFRPFRCRTCDHRHYGFRFARKVAATQSSAGTVPRPQAAAKQ